MTLAHRLERTYTGALYDTLRAMGHANCVLPHTIRPVDSGFSLAGPVWIVSGQNSGAPQAPKALWLSKTDNVAVIVTDCRTGETIEIGGERITLKADIPLGHKVAIRPIAADEKILRYGVPIGSAKCPIAAGEHVHVHNIRSDYLTNFTDDRPAGTHH